MRPSEAHIWIADLDLGAAAVAPLQTMLDTTELERASRFRFARDRDRFITGRARLREILGSFLEINPAAVTFDYGPAGKPRLAAPLQRNEPLHFNVSHSDSLIAIALTIGRDVGVDIESVRDIPEMDDIARKSFSFEVQEKLRLAPVSEKSALFFRAWTRCEAIAKCSGLGIAALGAHETFRGAVTEFTPRPGYIGALAVAAGNIELRIHQVVNPRAK